MQLTRLRGNNYNHDNNITNVAEGDNYITNSRNKQNVQ